MITSREGYVSGTYVQWNEKLLEYALANGVDKHGRFFLTVQQMLDDELDAADNIEDSFIDIVRAEYAFLLGDTRDPIRFLSEQSDLSGRPLSIALLGLSVLAAGQMDSNNYYIQLAKLLKQPQEGTYVRGFVPESFEQAWLGLNNYLQKCHGCYLDKPEYRTHRFVVWPRMHTLLRAVDTVKLPQFFKWGGITTTKNISYKEITTLFDHWRNTAYCNLTPTGRAACLNEMSRPGILLQVLRTLEQWDGTVPDGSSSESNRSTRIRTADAELVVDVSSSGTKIMLRTKRPDGFPAKIPIGDVTLLATSNTFYDDVRLPQEWGKQLQNGIEVLFRYTNLPMRFRLKGAPAFALIDPDLDGVYEASPALYVGVRSCTLCQTTYATKVENYLQYIGNASISQTKLASVLPGWTLFHNFFPRHSGVKAPDELDLLRVDSALLIQPVGGLRFGHAREWMFGAPPHSIELIGDNPPDEVLINGSIHRLADAVAPVFAEPRIYTIIAAKERYSLRIVEPNFNKNERSSIDYNLLCPEDNADIPAHDISAASSDNLAIEAPNRAPHSAYYELNFVSPSQCYAMSCSFADINAQGALLSAQWAVGIIEGQLSVIALRQFPTLPITPARLSLSWSKQILKASVARLGIFSNKQNAINDIEQTYRTIRLAWTAYIAAAERVKRSHVLRARHEEDEI